MNITSTNIFSKYLIAGTIILVFSSLAIMAQNIFVATQGNDGNPGTMESPKQTIQEGVNLLGAGDTLFIRGGRYHEHVSISGLHGSAGSEMVIMNFSGEEVILDGTEDLVDLTDSSWIAHDSNIYKIKLNRHLWQLFVDDRLQVIARWPNANTHPCDPISRKPGSWEAADGTWWSKETTWANADAAGTENGRVATNVGYHNLASTGLSFEGGSVILSVLEQGGDGNLERLITSHTAGTNTFTHPEIYPPKPDKAYRVNDKWFIIEHLHALDRPGEWYYTHSDSTLYLWPVDDQDPSGKHIRGRTQDQAITLYSSSYITIRGLKFFASNFDVDGEYITIQDCHLSYPDASHRLLGEYTRSSSEVPQMTTMLGPFNSLVNCVIEYTEFGGIFCNNAYASRIHNSLFHHLSIRGMGKNGTIEEVNTYTRNTFHTSGTRAAVKTNESPEEGRIQSYNLFDGFGYLQVPDGAALQVATTRNPGTIRSHNWFLNTPKYGSRWDGRPAGVRGTNHHQVGIICNATLQVKGNDHNTFNNTCLDSPAKNDILIISDPQFGGNLDSRTYNNLADKISGDRYEPVSQYPIPGKHSHNWNGYVTGKDANLQIRDVAIRDFRPRPDAEIIDAGMVIPGITDGYHGTAPDIGAYEFGDTVYWIPGRQERHASSPVPVNKGQTGYEFVDLMWLEGYESESSDVYFGTSEAAVENASRISSDYRGNQVSNIFYPGELTAGETYYWRVDAIQADDTVKGEVWSFTAGINANPEVYVVDYQVFGNRNGEVAPIDSAMIALDTRKTLTDTTGVASMFMIKEGIYSLNISGKGFMGINDSVHVSSDTSITDTLEYITYDLNILVRDLDSGEPIEKVEVEFDGKVYYSDRDGAIAIGTIDYGWYMVSTTIEGYLPNGPLPVEIFSDSMLVIELLKDYISVQVTVVDRGSETPVYRAKISYDEKLILTGDLGEASAGNLLEGYWSFSIDHKDYFLLSDSLYIRADTSVVISLVRRSANIQFTVNDITGPLENVPVDVNSWRGLTDNNGKVYIFGWPARNEYDYSVEFAGYQPATDTFYLEVDTIISVFLEPVTGIYSNQDERLFVYPVPAMDRLYIDQPDNNASFRLLGTDGRTCMDRLLFKGLNEIDVSGMSAGMYILVVRSEEMVRAFRISVQ